VSSGVARSDHAYSKSACLMLQHHCRPEGPLLSAQAEGLGSGTISRYRSDPERVIHAEEPAREWPFQGQTFPPSPGIPGLRPGLTETAFQAEDGAAESRTLI